MGCAEHRFISPTVIPMLPEELSNGICSLNGETGLPCPPYLRLINGNMQGCADKKSVFRSRVRGVYSEVNMLFDGNADPDIQSKYDVRPTLDSRELAALLRKMRRLNAAPWI